MKAVLTRVSQANTGQLEGLIRRKYPDHVSF
ncbi:uncharacterized protein METZ01_LOCUS359594 [marine metagenome]|uniref:Uncharacterized protein n=1 Tax=marine metagenome TaxID=408172 RepID=A0A382SA00_9ZZZZ